MKLAKSCENSLHSHSLALCESSHGAKTVSSAVGASSNYIRWIIDAFYPYFGDTILEVGIGSCDYYSYLPSHLRYVGCDSDGDLIQQASKRYPNLDFVLSDVVSDNFVQTLAGNNFDTILCVSVLGLIPKQEVALANMLSALDPGGHLLLLVPAFECLRTDLDHLSGQLHRYTKKSLSNLFLGLEGEIVKMQYFNCIGALGTLANRTVSHHSLESQRFTLQMKLFDKFLLPISKLLNPISSSFFGQSIIFVVRKF